MPPEAIDRGETFLMEKIPVPAGGHWNQHTFERKPLAVDLADRIAVLTLDLEEEIHQCHIEIGGGTENFFHHPNDRGVGFRQCQSGDGGSGDVVGVIIY